MNSTPKLAKFVAYLQRNPFWGVLNRSIGDSFVDVDAAKFNDLLENEIEIIELWNGSTNDERSEIKASAEGVVRNGAAISPEAFVAIYDGRLLDILNSHRQLAAQIADLYSLIASPGKMTLSPAVVVDMLHGLIQRCGLDNGQQKEILADLDGIRSAIGDQQAE